MADWFLRIAIIAVCSAWGWAAIHTIREWLS